MKIEHKEVNLAQVKTAYLVNFGTTKKTSFEVWEYKNGYLAFPTHLKFTASAREAVTQAIKSYVQNLALCS